MNSSGVMVKFIGEETPVLYGAESDASLRFLEIELKNTEPKFLMIENNGKTAAVNLDRVEYIKFNYKGA